MRLFPLFVNLFILSPTRHCFHNASGESLAADSGFSSRIILDLQRFMASSKVTDQNKTTNMSHELASQMKEILQFSSRASAKVALVFKANSRLRTVFLLKFCSFACLCVCVGVWGGAI